MSVLRDSAVPHFVGRWWVWFGHKRTRRWRDSADCGKFLFFARDPELLYGIAVNEIADHGFQVAKVCLKPRNGRDYVLCLYAPDDSRADEVEQRYESEYDQHGVIYRGWKLQSATRRSSGTCSGGGRLLPHGDQGRADAMREIDARYYMGDDSDRWHDDW